MSGPWEAYQDAQSSTDQKPWEQFASEPAKPTSAMRKMADLGLGFASGAVGATKALTDVAGAGNKASKVLADLNTGINDYLSPEAKADQQEQGRIMSDAGGKGVWEGVKAGAKAFAVAPVQTAVQGLGSVVPIVAGTALTGGAATAAAAGAGLGVAMGAGTAKGAIYDEIKKRGGTDAEATEAQAYGGANTDQIALGGALGAVDALTGVSKAASGVVRGALGKPVAQAATQAAERGIVSRAGMGMLGEMPLEAAQGGQEQVAANLAAQRAGYEAGTWDNVASNATMEALASAGPGAAFGAMGGRGAPEAKDTSIPPVTPTEPPAGLLGNTPDPLIAFPDGTVGRQAEVDAYVAGLPEDQKAAARARLLGLGPQPATPPAPAITEPAPPPSVQMGIDASAGVISKVAAQSVDTGVTQEIEFNQAAAEEQAAYDQAMAAQDEQAAAQDSVDKPVTSGAIAEAQMSEEDKRAVLFSNQAVADGGRQYVGTQDGDVLNGMGAPFTTRLAAARRANLEGKDWTIAPVFDGWVARRKDAIDGASSGVSPAAAGRSESGGDQPAPGVGSGVAADDGVGTDTSGRADDVVGEPLQSSGGVDEEAVNAETNAPLAPADIAQAATETIADVQNPTPAANDAQAEPAPVETGAPVASAAALAEGLPGAGSAPVEPVGVKATDKRLIRTSKRHKSSIEIDQNNANSSASNIGDKPNIHVVAGNEETMPLQDRQGVREVRGEGDNDLPRVGLGLPKVSGRSGGEAKPPTYAGKDQESSRVSAGQRQVGDTTRADAQSHVKPGVDIQRENPSSKGLGQRSGDEPTSSVRPIEEGVVFGTGIDGTSALQNAESQKNQANRRVDIQTAPAANPALDRIAAGKAWFGNALKAGEFIAKNSLKDTHEAVKTAPNRWDVRAKEQTNEALDPADIAQPATNLVAQPEETTNGTQAPEAQQSQEAQPEKAAEPVAAEKPTLRKAQAKRLEERAGEFVAAPDGSIDYGEITPAMSKAMRRQAGKIRLRRGNDAWGLTHIEARHGEQFKSLGFQSANDYIAHVASSFNAVYKGSGAGLSIVLETERTGGRLMVQLEPSPDGDFYDVKSASPIRAGQYKNEEPLWQRAGTSAPSAQGSSLLPRDQNGDESVALTGQKVKGGGALLEGRAQPSLPAASELAAGPVVRLPYQPAAEVVYSEPRADGKPFSNALDRGVKPVEKEPVARVETAQAATENVAKNATPAAKPESTGKIEDFGETIGGAKKMLYAEAYADNMAKAKELAIAEHPLSKTWPEPDYQKLLEGGADPWAVAFVHAARDAVPNKPQKGWKLKGWVSNVELLRSLSDSMVRPGSDTAERAQAMIATKRYASLKEDFGGNVDLYLAVGHGQSLKGLNLSSGTYGIYQGVEYNPPKKFWAVTKTSPTSAYGNWRTELAVGDTKEEAIAKFKEKLSTQEAEKPEAKGTTFEVYSTRGVKENPYFIGKKIGKTVANLKSGFADLKSVRAYMAENKAELEELLAKYKHVPDVRNAENAPRVGGDHRKNGDVTPEQFHDAFGFRGVQFGNYVEGPRRQKDLNDAYDALMDLAGVINVPPKALSLDGRLGLAFGARGSGDAMAHYEPGQVVINLTKTQGAGSLAHEWWHAMDNYFAKDNGGPSTYLTESTSGGTGVRPEMRAAFDAVRTTIGATALRERSRLLDDRRSKDYWTTGREMSARSFESYVIAKLQDQGASNDYLANIVNEVLFALQGAYPYPSAGEMPQIRAAFDGFFQAVQTKETDKGVALYSRGYAGNPTTVENLRAAIKDMTGVSGLNKLGRVVATTAADIKTTWEPLLGKKVNLASEGDAGMAQAFYDPKSKTVFLVSDRIREGTEAAVLAHELMHKHGVPVLGKEGWDRLHDVIGTWANADKESPEYSVWRYASNKVAAVGEKLSNQELFPYAVEAVFKMGIKPDAEASRGTVARWLDTVVQSLKTVWAKVTNRPDTFDAQDLVNLAFGIAQMENPDSAAAVRRFQEAPTAEEEIQYSRTLAGSLAGAANDVHDVNLTAGYTVGDLLKGAPGKLSWWHKTVGTMYDLAQRSPQFKRVFDGVQNFINDVSYYATEAADLAPNILPKLETWKDITKAPLSAEDTKAISAPIFEGTLVWARDEAGKPIKIEALEAQAAALTPEQKAQRLLRQDKVSAQVLKMWQGLPVDQFETIINGKYEREMLKAGVVWSDAELRDMFNLTAEQIPLYREFRAATDRSLTNLAISDMLRFGGKDVMAVREQALAAENAMQAGVLLRDHLLAMAEQNPERSDVLVDTANTMIDKADKAQDLIARGYAPLSRYGQYTLDVVDASGERVYFGMFEGKMDAARMARKMEQEYPGATITRGTVSEEEYKLFAGVSPETLELFGDMLGLEAQGDSAANKAFQTYLKLAKSNRSSMKRMIQRKGIAGFSEDSGRVLAGFVYSNARQTASNLHMGEMTEAATEVSKGQGELKDQAVRLVDYVKNPREEAQAFRGLLFAQYIGGSVASAMVNMTQPMTMTFPWLSQYGGAAGAAKQIGAAMKDANKRLTGDARLDAALRRAEEDGTVSPQEVHQLMQQSQGRGALRSGDGTKAGTALAAANNALSRFSLGWGKLFSLAEQFNRRTTFIAAYRTAVAQGIEAPEAFARKAIAETQGVYNKGNKPAWARGAVGSTLFTFKQYSIAYVEMLHRMATQGGPEGKKAALLALGVLFLMSGAGGLPGGDDLDDLISFVMQRLGYNYDSKAKRQEFFASLVGEGGARFLETGVSGLPGMPLDVSGRLGMGNLIPGTGLLTKKVDHTRDLAEIAGPAGDFGKRIFEAAGKTLDGDVFGINGAARTVAPKAFQNLVQAFDMANMGMYRDAKGMKVLDADGYDAALKAIGFQPNDVKRVQDASFEAQRMIGLNKLRETEIANRWALGIFEKDTDKVKAAREELAEWNASNPESPIRINFKQILQRVQKMNQSKTERITATAPKEIRADVRRALEVQ